MQHERFYSEQELKPIIEQLEFIKPKNTPKEIEDLVPEKIFKNMNAYLRKDLQELIDCYAYNLWTATCLMGFRIVERELKNHIYADLDGPDHFRSISACIKYLEEENYTAKFIEVLKRIRIERNVGMHGEKRFSSQDANYFLCWAIYISVWIYNHI